MDLVNESDLIRAELVHHVINSIPQHIIDVMPDYVVTSVASIAEGVTNKREAMLFIMVGCIEADAYENIRDDIKNAVNLKYYLDLYFNMYRIANDGFGKLFNKCQTGDVS